MVMMEVSLIERDEKGVTIKVKQEDISVLNILQHEIAKHESVDIVGVAQRHYLIPEYEFRVSMKHKDDDPFKMIAEAVESALNVVRAMKEEVRSKVSSSSSSSSNSNSSNSNT
ncbi:MAG: RpoL/Rpb11 RNA polymerase subunit family protein [Candidatus Nitrosocaldus sp.]